jgi:hypothetical protein
MMGSGRGEVLLHLKMAGQFLAALDRGGPNEYIADDFEGRWLSE